MRPFETERLLLRPLTWSDLETLYELYQQPEIMKYISGEPSSFEETQHLMGIHIADHERNGFGLCAAILKKDGKMVGRCGLIPIEKSTGLEGDIAWMFKQAYWNQGLATEFAQRMIEIGFEQIGVKRIQATAANQNGASIRVMIKVGMQFVKADHRGVEYEIYPQDMGLNRVSLRL